MPVPPLLPVAEAAVFTAGCIVIHIQRRRADTITAMLATLAGLLLFLVGVASLPESYVAQQERTATEEIRTGTFE